MLRLLLRKMPRPQSKMLCRVAKIVKSNGTDGELLVNLLEGWPDDLKKTEPVYIEIDGLPVPFFVLSLRSKGNRNYLRLNDVDSLTDAEELVGSYICLEGGDEEAVPSMDNLSEIGMDALVGWMLEDADGSRIGEITSFEDIPGNPCICVGEILVPLHEDLILDVDSDTRTLTMEIPDGLV